MPVRFAVSGVNSGTPIMRRMHCTQVSFGVFHDGFIPSTIKVIEYDVWVRYLNIGLHSMSASCRNNIGCASTYTDVVVEIVPDW
jgi:hypothetical protein